MVQVATPKHKTAKTLSCIFKAVGERGIYRMKCFCTEVKSLVRHIPEQLLGATYIALQLLWTRSFPFYPSVACSRIPTESIFCPGLYVVQELDAGGVSSQHKAESTQPGCCYLQLGPPVSLMAIIYLFRWPVFSGGLARHLCAVLSGIGRVTAIYVGGTNRHIQKVLVYQIRLAECNRAKKTGLSATRSPGSRLNDSLGGNSKVSGGTEGN